MGKPCAGARCKTPHLPLELNFAIATLTPTLMVRRKALRLSTRTFHQGDGSAAILTRPTGLLHAVAS
jgi:hypothetical protein